MRGSRLSFLKLAADEKITINPHCPMVKREVLALATGNIACEFQRMFK